MIAVQSSAFIIGPIAKILGYIINVIYNFLDAVGIGNIVLSIILFTIVVQILMIPIKYKAQKFTRVSSMIQPEINEIRKKYAGKRDQQSMSMMQAETSEIYKKYGASPAGGCLPMLIQMPILFALYAVIQSIPSYIGKIYDLFAQVADKVNTPSAIEAMSNIKYVANLQDIASNKATLVDYLYTYNMGNWTDLVNKVSDIPRQAVDSILSITKVFGDVLVSDTPWQLIKSHNYIHWVWLIPILVYASAYFSMKTTQSHNKNDMEDNPAARQMKTMTTIMPIMSVVFSIALPVGLGIYWIINSLIMGIQQVAMNRYIDSIGLEKIVEKNIEKNKDKIEKQKEKKGVSSSTVKKAAHLNTKSIKNESADVVSNETPSVESTDNKSISSLARLTDKYKDK